MIDSLAADSNALLPWHRPAHETLIEQYMADRLPHALLVLAGADTGKHLFAQSLVRRLLCQRTDGAIAPCGQCHACELANAGHNSDLCWVEPAGSSRFIKVEQVRAAIAFTQGTATFSPNKVLVFRQAQTMNLSAHNALLKSLEEPTVRTYFLLLCDSLGGIPATIRSRCRSVQLPNPSNAQSIDWLQGEHLDESGAGALIELTQGRPLLADQLLREDRVEQYTTERLSLRALLGGQRNVTDVWQVFTELSPDNFLQLFCSELRLRLASLSSDELKSAEGRTLFQLLDEAQGIARAVAGGSNPAPQMLVDQLLSKSHRQLGQARGGVTI